MPPAPPQRGTSPGEEFGGPPRKNRWANPNVAAAEGKGDIVFVKRCKAVPWDSRRKHGDKPNGVKGLVAMASVDVNMKVPLH